MLTSEDRAEIKQLIAEALRYGNDRSTLVLPARTTTATFPNVEQPLDPVINITARAIEVFGTREKALDWLKSPVLSLGNATPVSLLNSDQGVRQVEDVLGRIEHGLW